MPGDRRRAARPRRPTTRRASIGRDLRVPDRARCSRTSRRPSGPSTRSSSGCSRTATRWRRCAASTTRSAAWSASSRGSAASVGDGPITPRPDARPPARPVPALRAAQDPPRRGGGLPADRRPRRGRRDRRRARGRARAPDRRLTSADGVCGTMAQGICCRPMGASSRRSADAAVASASDAAAHPAAPAQEPGDGAARPRCTDPAGPGRSGHRVRARRRRASRSIAAGPRSAATTAGWSRSCWSCSPAARPTATRSSASSSSSGSPTARSTSGQVYRTLRDLEQAGQVRSIWTTGYGRGPPRLRAHRAGFRALDEWAAVMKERDAPHRRVRRPLPRLDGRSARSRRGPVVDQARRIRLERLRHRVVDAAGQSVLLGVAQVRARAPRGRAPPRRGGP